MANKETQELILEAIEYYITNGLCPDGGIQVDQIDLMKKLIKLDEIKTGLENKGDEQ